MNIKNCIKKIKIWLKEQEYKKYIERHRNNIIDAAYEMMTCPGLSFLFDDVVLCEFFMDRISIHDLSKYEKEEFDAYRKYYYPISLEEKTENSADFLRALEHHYRTNEHHWEHRVNNINFDPNNINDVLAVLENVADWLAVGYQFNNRPYQYYEKHKQEINLCEKEKKFLERVIYALEED